MSYLLDGSKRKLFNKATRNDTQQIEVRVSLKIPVRSFQSEPSKKIMPQKRTDIFTLANYSEARTVRKKAPESTNRKSGFNPIAHYASITPYTDMKKE